MKLEEAKSRARAAISSKRESLAFAAPELQDMHWSDLNNRIKSLIDDIYKGDPDSSEDRS